MFSTIIMFIFVLSLAMTANDDKGLPNMLISTRVEGLSFLFNIDS